MLPEVPNQVKARETHLPSLLQSPLKDRCVRILPWGRGDESHRLRFALEYIALLSVSMQLHRGQPPGKRAEWRRAESRNGEETGE